MKAHIPLLFIAVSAFLLSGCYTQLQYSQRMNRISHDHPREGKTYSWDGEEDKRTQQPRSATQAEARAASELPPDTLTNYEEGYDDGYFDATEDAFYYRDYAAADWYARHGFGHYPRYYGSYYNSFYRNFGYPYYHDYYYPRSAVTLRFHFGFGARHYYGSPYYWSRISPWHYWDPFYAADFGYGYGYSPVFIHNYYGTGFSHYVGVSRDRNDRSYGRRSIGTNRVRSDVRRGSGNAAAVQPGTRTDVRQKRGTDTNTSILRNRGRTDVNRQGSGTRTSRGSTVRSRGTSRTGSSGTVNRGSRGSSPSNESGTRSRSRSRDNLRSQSQSLYFPSRSMLDEARVLNRIRNSRAPETTTVTSHPQERTRRGSRVINTLLNAAKQGASVEMNSVRTRVRTGSSDSDNSGSATTRTRVRSRSDSGSSGSSGSSSSGRSRSRQRN